MIAKVKTPLNYDFTEDSDIEIITSKSITIPDQTLSLSKILQRHARGLPTIGREDIYHGDDTFIPNMKTLDLAEQQQLREQTAEFIRFTQGKLKTLQEEQHKVKEQQRKTAQQQQWAEFMEFKKTQQNEPDEKQTDAR